MTVAVSKAVEAGPRPSSAPRPATRRPRPPPTPPGPAHLRGADPAGKIATGKLAQALVHGARPLQVAGNFDDCLALASKLAIDYPVALVNSVNIDRLHGQKTAAFEIVEALGDAPDIHCLPVGNAGNITAYWMGYARTRRRQRDRGPKMYGFQASGAAPIVTAQWSPSRPRSPPPSASATRPRGPRRSTPATSPAASSRR
jgi:threonine synthase